MDKIDEFLKSKSDEEKEKFMLPQSFNNKVNNVLINLEIDKGVYIKERKGKNNFFIAAASIAVILIVGKVMLFANSLKDNENSKNNLARSASLEERPFNIESEEDSNINKDEFMNIVHEIEDSNINKIIIDNVEITDANRINEILSYIKCINAEYCESIQNEGWLVSMKLYGDKSYNIYIGNKYVEINSQVFISSEEEINNLVSLIK